MENDFYGFANGSGIDKLAWKGVLYTKILLSDREFGGDYLHLFNTHLQASYTGNQYKKSDHKDFEVRLN